MAGDHTDDELPPHTEAFLPHSDSTKNIQKSPILITSYPKLVFTSPLDPTTVVPRPPVDSLVTEARKSIDLASNDIEIHPDLHDVVNESLDTSRIKQETSHNSSIDKRANKAKKIPLTPSIPPDPSCFKLTKDGYYYDYRTAYYYRFDCHCNMYFPISVPQNLHKTAEVRQQESTFTCSICKKHFPSKGQRDFHESNSETHKVPHKISHLLE